MSPKSVFDQLGEQQVPERPSEFGRELHERINTRLTIVHLVEFSIRVLPYAFFHFCNSLGGAVFFSFTGRYPERGTHHASGNDQDR